MGVRFASSLLAQQLPSHLFFFWSLALTTAASSAQIALNGASPSNCQKDHMVCLKIFALCLNSVQSIYFYEVCDLSPGQGFRLPSYPQNHQGGLVTMVRIFSRRSSIRIFIRKVPITKIVQNLIEMLFHIWNVIHLILSEAQLYIALCHSLSSFVFFIKMLFQNICDDWDSNPWSQSQKQVSWPLS